MDTEDRETIDSIIRSCFEELLSQLDREILPVNGVQDRDAAIYAVDTMRFEMQKRVESYCVRKAARNGKDRIQGQDKPDEKRQEPAGDEDRSDQPEKRESSPTMVYAMGKPRRIGGGTVGRGTDHLASRRPGTVQQETPYGSE